MHIKYSLFGVLFFTACIPREPNDLLGESDRPVAPTGVPDSGVTDDVNTPSAELTVDPNSIVVTVIGESTEIEPSLVLSVDDNDSRVLYVEHTVEWDSDTISTVLVTQTDDYALDFDYGSSGETYIWLIVQYSVDISSLEAGTYSVTAEGARGEFVLE